MAFKRMFQPSNRRVRVLVGLLLAALFAVQCTRSEAFKEGSGVVAIEGKILGKNPDSAIAAVEQMAKTDHVALLEHCLSNYRSKYVDYTCSFTKQEVIKGQTKEEQVMDVKFMDKPFSVAMHWTQNAPIGDSVIYVEGKYGNQMLVRPTNGLLRKIAGTISRAPDDQEAMRNTLRPVNMFGFERSMKSLLDVYRLAKTNGDLRQEFVGYVKVNDRPALALARYLPDKPQYAVAASKTLVFIDAEYLVPVRVEGYDWCNKLTSRYEYSNIKFNMGLTEDDFLPENNGMKSPK